MSEARLVTADGAVFRGRSVGIEGTTTGEVIFNTAMTGYQEVFSDPSYAGQVVVMTSSHIGNYGTTSLDDQSDRMYAAGVVMRSMSRRESNWRAEGTLADYFQAHNVVALADVDTRRLTAIFAIEAPSPSLWGLELRKPICWPPPRLPHR